MLGRTTLATLLTGLALALLTWGVYRPAEAGAFLELDDRTYVTDNEGVTGGLSADSVSWAFTTAHAGNWHPLTWISHMLDVELGGLEPRVHHRTNVLLHALNVVLLFALLQRMTGALRASAVVALLFGLHPIHVESVAWISERKDVLAACFGLGALHAWVSWVRRGGAPRYGTALVLYALALMAKPTVVTLPFVLLLLDGWPLARLREPDGTRVLGRRVTEKLPWFALSLVSCLVTMRVQAAGGAVASGVAVALPDRLANALVAYATYLKHLAWPNGLHAGYPHPTLLGTDWSGGVIAGSLGLLLLISLLVWRARGRAPALLTGWLFFLGVMVPMIGLVQVGGQALADRYAYLAAIGIYLALAFGLVRLDAGVPRGTLALVALALLGALIPLTRRQIATWQSTETLARHALAEQPEAWSIELAYGNALRREGRDTEAIERFRHVVQVVPGLAVGHFNLANALHDSGDTEGAVRHYEEALRLDPAYARAHLNLGATLLDRRELARAEEHFREACRLMPTSSLARYNLGNALGLQRKLEEAVVQYEAALELDPLLDEARANLALLREAIERRG